VNTVAFDPQQPDVAYAGMEGGGIAKSVDGGVTWQTRSAGLTSPRVAELVVHPRLSRLIYGRYEEGPMLRSENGGRSWSTLAVPGSKVWAVAPVASDPARVYAGSDVGIFQSVDSGTTWQAVAGRGLPKFYTARSLAVDATDPRLLYAGLSGSSGFGFWVSEDGGRHWARRNRSTPDRIVVDPRRSGTVYVLRGVVQRSRNRGLTWEPYFDDVELGIVFDPHDPATAYVYTSATVAGARFAIDKTTNDGATWQPIQGGGLPSGLSTVYALAISPAGPLLAADNLTDLFRSTDGGATWSRAGKGLVNTSIWSLAFGRPGTLFAAANDGVHRSRDNGASWVKVLDLQQVLSLAVDPSDPDTVYVGTAFPFGEDPHIVWKTTDGGATWTPLPFPQSPHPTAGVDATDLAVDPVDPQVLFLASPTTPVGTADGGGVYRSADGGQTWTKAPEIREGSHLAVSPGAPGTVWAIWLLGLYKSTDSGLHWSLALTGSPDHLLRAVAPAPSNPDVVWALGDTDTYRSLDGGSTWRRLSGLPSPYLFPFNDAAQHPLVVDPTDPDTVYAAWRGGASRRAPGTRWQPLNNGLFGTEESTIDFDPADPRRLLMGTGGFASGAGLFEYHLALPQGPE